MSNARRFHSLIQKGYFPEELPPPFHTEDLARNRTSILKKWKLVQQTAAAQGLYASYPKTTYEQYSVPRITNHRRVLAITNPVSQMYLSKLIADNWGALKKCLHPHGAIHKLDIMHDKSRAVPKPDFKAIEQIERNITACHDYVLVSDVSRFYGTLYTHAIPWALHTKAWCKKNLSKKIYTATLGNQLDEAIRKCQDNQSIGIPVGPDTSRVISELLGCAMDQELECLLKKKLTPSNYHRNVDDWFIGFDSIGEAEDSIAKLSTISRNFELEIHPEKTRIRNAAFNHESYWPITLQNFALKKTGSAQAKSIESFFNLAFRLGAEYPSQNVLNYAVRKSGYLIVSPENWLLYETFLLKAARSNQTLLPVCVEILVNYNYRGYSITKDRAQKLIEDLIKKNAPLGNHSEVAWALFLAKALRITLNIRAVKSITKLESSICALLLLDLNNSALIQGKLDTSNWLLHCTLDGLQSNMWLLAYEANLKGWISTSTDYVNQHPYFSVLKSKGVSFYDVKKNVKKFDVEKSKKAQHINIPQTAATSTLI